MSPSDFDLSLRFRVVFTERSADKAVSLARELGCGRVLLVVDPGVQQAGLAGAFEQSFQGAGISLDLFNQVEPNPTTSNVEQGLAQARDFRPDMFLALGGGSAMDCAKAVDLLLSYGGDLEDYVGLVEKRGDLFPLVAIPTTAGTGSEVSPFLLISDPDQHAKLVIKAPSAIPRAALLDPNLSVTLPAQATLYSGLDALVHAIESYVARGSQPYSQALASRAVETILQNLPRVMESPGDLQARGRMLLASNLAGMAFCLSYLGLAHAAANALSKAYGLVHGLAVATMLPHVIRFNRQVAGREYRALARQVLGAQCPEDPDQASLQLASFLEEFMRSLGAPRNLAELGVERGRAEELAEEALGQASLKANPRQASRRELERLFLAACGEG